MHTSSQIWRQFLAQAASLLPLRSYGELVLRPVTIAERTAGAEIAFSSAHNKK